jgi:hypothetical protein
VEWIGWHFGELVAVGAPTVLALTAHPLWTVPAVVAAVGWIANEVRVTRQHTRAATPGTDTTEANGVDQEGGVTGGVA